MIKTPSQLFINPIDITMFQLSSAINIIAHMKTEIESYKTLLRKAKNEIEKMKGAFKENVPLKQSLTKKNIQNKIRKIYALPAKPKGKDIELMSASIASKKRKPRAKASNTIANVLDFSECDKNDDSLSSVNSRITIPKGFDPYKRNFRK